MLGWCLDAVPASDGQGTGNVAALATCPEGFTCIDVPGALATRAFGVNPQGDVVGSFTDTAGTHGYLLSDGVFPRLQRAGGHVRVRAAGKQRCLVRAAVDHRPRGRHAQRDHARRPDGRGPDLSRAWPG